MAVVTPALYEAARARLDTSLDLALPDAVLHQFAESAEAELLRLDADAETRTGTAYKAVQRAAACLLAAVVAPSLPRLKGESFGQDYSYTADPGDWSARAAELRGAARREVEGYLAAASTTRRPTFFAAAGGTRGW